MSLRTDAFKETQLPVDVFRLARERDITIYPRLLPSFVSGILYKYDIGSYMYLNVTQPMTRKRFTVAHEIAHHILHPAGIYTENGTRSRIEREANALAAKILMPAQSVLEYLERGYTVPEMARVFGVSREAMNIRIEEVTQNPILPWESPEYFDALLHFAGFIFDPTL